MALKAEFEEDAASASLRVRVVSTSHVATRVREFTLEAADGVALPEASPGAHLTLNLPGGFARTYSLTGPPRDDGRYRIAVLHDAAVSRGGSRWMHEALAPGHVLDAAAPANLFPLAQDARSHLLIAGGIGVTPLAAMALSLAQQGAEVQFIYIARTEAEAAYLDVLRSTLGERLSFHATREPSGARPDIAAHLAEPGEGRHLYVCGPDAMIGAVRAAAAHWPQDHVHSESFAGAIAASGLDEPFEVELARTGRRLRVPADISLLRCLEAAGVPVKAVCREGWCGTCRLRVLGGEVDHRDDVLEDDERAEFMQACVSRAVPGSTLRLDL